MEIDTLFRFPELVKLVPLYEFPKVRSESFRNVLYGNCFFFFFLERLMSIPTKALAFLNLYLCILRCQVNIIIKK